ncbi:DNA-methyltransferase [Paenibacillus humicus]|uniref:DNA-methyltransferase n=1 Tax=Paenibacillus humicus TaxID=412861 RepID=UPI003D2ADBC9
MNRNIEQLELNQIYQLDVLEGLSLLPDNSVDSAIDDPPYNIGLVGAHVNLRNGYQAINEDWDKIENFEEFTTELLCQLYRVLKPGGSLLNYGTHHNIFLTGQLMKYIGFKVKMMYVWKKLNPPPSFLGTNPTYATEFIIWAVKEGSKCTYNLDYAKHINSGKNIRNVFETPLTPQREKKYGKFPCQKPLDMTTKLINLHSNENDVVLVPFCGSGTEVVAAALSNRQFISFDINQKYIDIANARLNNLEESRALVSGLLNPTSA